MVIFHGYVKQPDGNKLLLIVPITLTHIRETYIILSIATRPTLRRFPSLE